MAIIDNNEVVIKYLQIICTGKIFLYNLESFYPGSAVCNFKVIYIEVDLPYKYQITFSLQLIIDKDIFKFTF